MAEREKFIALAGCGSWGRNILRNLRQMGVLGATCDKDPDVLSLNKRELPELMHTHSFDQILSDERITAVALATPAATHYALAKQAILKGKDVFVEKPLALSSSEAEELAVIADKCGSIIMVGHVLKYHPAVQKLKQLVDKGELGQMRYIYSNRLNIGKLRSEENILWSFAPHDISVILDLVGEEPESVTAFGGAYVNGALKDVTVTALGFKGGVKGHIFVSWLHPYKEQKLIAVGSRAMAVFNDLSDEKLSLYPHKVDLESGKVPVVRRAEKELIAIGPGEPLRLELEHFVECLRLRKTPLTDKYEALRVLRVLERAERSMFSSDERNRKVSE